MPYQKHRSGQLSAAHRREFFGTVAPAVQVSDTPAYFAGYPDPSQTINLDAYTRGPEAGLPSPLESQCINPQQSWIQPRAGFEKLYREGHLQVPSNSAFGRALQPNDIQTMNEATQLGFQNVQGAPVYGVVHTEARTLYDTAYKAMSEACAAPGEHRPGVCPICGHKSSSIAAHLFSGPHADAWLRAAAGSGMLTLVEWRHFLLVYFAHQAAYGAGFNPDEINTIKWVLSQTDRLLRIKEPVGTPVYPMPQPGQVVAGLEYLIPFIGRLNFWAQAMINQKEQVMACLLN